jgi:hypothetical protein
MRIQRTYLFYAAVLCVVAVLMHFGWLHHDAGVAFAGIGALTPSGARVIDPVLTNIAQGYRNGAMVGELLFPVVPVQQRGGKIIAFGKEDFQLYATGRAPGANTKRVTFGYSSDSYALSQYALEGTVPFEIMQEAQAVPGINMGRVAVQKTQNIIALQAEKAAADLATSTSNYDSTNKTALSGTSQWSDADNSDPIGDIETGKEAVRGLIGRRPNLVIIGAAVFAKLKVNSAILDRIKYTGRDTPTVELLASLFDVQTVAIGDAIYDDDGTMTDLWGKNVVLAYTERGSIADMGLPSYGYTYRLDGYPIVETPYEDRNAKSWVYPVTDERDPVIAAKSAGYLISSAIA